MTDTAPLASAAPAAFDDPGVYTVGLGRQVEVEEVPELLCHTGAHADDVMHSPEIQRRQRCPNCRLGSLSLICAKVAARILCLIRLGVPQ
ncbi:hypothetical protein ACIRRA_23155 [Nocardia sp. NPDC101769]|uniref:hypothetical protein n=1 Tax=Nocardia sp. NPDC101769 TaxID=3364333 RepID=UPI0038070888